MLGDVAARQASKICVSLPKTPSPRLALSSESEHDGRVIAIASLFDGFLCDCFKPRQRLEAEILALRHQLNILPHAVCVCVGPTARSSSGCIGAFRALLMP
jgi:hypothetical protein